MDSVASSHQPSAISSSGSTAQPSPYSDAETGRRGDAGPGQDCIEVTITAEQLRALIVEFGAMRHATLLADDQYITLALFIARCREEYRELTGIDLVVEPERRARS